MTFPIVLIIANTLLAYINRNNFIGGLNLGMALMLVLTLVVETHS